MRRYFFKISHGILVGTTETTSRQQLPYSIIMPDQFFVGTRMVELRKEVIKELDFYIPFSRNKDPKTNNRYFYGVAHNRRFGIAFGKVNQKRKYENIFAKPLGEEKIDIPYKKIGLLPLPTSYIQLFCLKKLIQLKERVRDTKESNSWKVGEWDGTDWKKIIGRAKLDEKKNGGMPLVKAQGLSQGYGLEFNNISQVLWWVKSSNKEDQKAAMMSRIIVGDAVRSAGKIVHGGYLQGSEHRLKSGVICSAGVACQNALLYCSKNKSWLVYINSIFYELAVRCIAGANHINAWRLNLIGFPRFKVSDISRLSKKSYPIQQIEMGRMLGVYK